MRKYTLLLVFITKVSFAQNITGTWSGILKVMQMELPIVFHINEHENGLMSTMDSPKQGANGIPMEETTFEDGELRIQAPALGIIYTAKFAEKDTLKGVFNQNGMNLALILARGVVEEAELKRPQEPQPPYPYYTEDFTLKNEKEGNLLAGSLFAPDKNKEHPILVMITGSGPQNRDEEIVGHKPFLVIADHLARNGIATFRMDDRGVDGSESGKDGATSADFAGDIASAVNFLSAMGYKNIGLIGHSEGGMVAPMVYKQNKKVKFMVLLAAPGIPIPELMKLQTYRTTLAMGLTENFARQSADKNEKLYHFINTHKGKHFEEDLIAFLKTENKGINQQQLEATLNQVNNAWFRYFMAFDPHKYLKKVKVPVLAINGDKDVQVTSEENLEGIRKSLNRAKNKQFEIVEFTDLNHMFQTAETGSITEYEEIEETIAPEVLEKITVWIKGLKFK